MENEQETTPVPTTGSASWKRIDVILNLLSKPVCLAVISGLFIALITNWVQSNADHKEKERARLQAMREKKLQLLGSFDTAFNNRFGSEIWYEQKSN